MRRESQIGRWPLIAVPLTAVRITRAGHAPAVADSCTAMLYNAHQPYRAEQLLDDQPERTLYLVPDEQTLGACVAQFEDPSHAMPIDRGPIAPRTFARLRKLVALLEDEPARSSVDPVGFHEAVTNLVGELLEHAIESRGIHSNGLVRAAQAGTRHREIATSAREFCLQHFAEPLDLDDVATAVGASRFHVCRIFRRFHRRSIHQYLTELRLRASLEAVCDRTAPLARVALQAGFSSQSHFTTAFTRRFGQTPAAYRRAI